MRIHAYYMHIYMHIHACCAPYTRIHAHYMHIYMQIHACCALHMRIHAYYMHIYMHIHAYCELYRRIHAYYIHICVHIHAYCALYMLVYMHTSQCVRACMCSMLQTEYSLRGSTRILLHLFSETAVARPISYSFFVLNVYVTK
jgi:hypothetical protein